MFFQQAHVIWTRTYTFLKKGSVLLNNTSTNYNWYVLQRTILINKYFLWSDILKINMTYKLILRLQYSLYCRLGL
jgi:hypothetical protein